MMVTYKLRGFNGDLIWFMEVNMGFNGDLMGFNDVQTKSVKCAVFFLAGWATEHVDVARRRIKFCLLDFGGWNAFVAGQIHTFALAKAQC